MCVFSGRPVSLTPTGRDACGSTPYVSACDMGHSRLYFLGGPTTTTEYCYRSPRVCSRACFLLPNVASSSRVVAKDAILALQEPEGNFLGWSLWFGCSAMESLVQMDYFLGARCTREPLRPKQGAPRTLLASPPSLPRDPEAQTVEHSMRTTERRPLSVSRR